MPYPNAGFSYLMHGMTQALEACAHELCPTRHMIAPADKRVQAVGVSCIAYS